MQQMLGGRPKRSFERMANAILAKDCWRLLQLVVRLWANDVIISAHQGAEQRVRAHQKESRLELFLRSLTLKGNFVRAEIFQAWLGFVYSRRTRVSKRQNVERITSRFIGNDSGILLQLVVRLWANDVTAQVVSRSMRSLE